MSSKPPYRTINPLTAVRINQQPRALLAEDNSPQKRELLQIVGLRSDYQSKYKQAEQLPTKENIHAALAAKKQWLDSCRTFALINKGLAVASAREHNGGQEPTEDLIQAAFHGLYEAIQRFDPSKANRISSFAVWRMLYRCQEAQGRSTLPVHTSRTLQVDASEVAHVEEIMRLQTGELPSDEALLTELARREEISNKKRKKPRTPKWSAVESLIRMCEARNFTNYSTPFDEGYRSHSADKTSFVSLEDTTDLHKVLQKLTPAMRAVIANEYGVGSLLEQDLPQRTVTYDITLAVALTRLRKALR